MTTRHFQKTTYASFDRSFHDPSHQDPLTASTPASNAGGGGGTGGGGGSTPITAAELMANNSGNYSSTCIAVTNNTSYGSSLNGYSFSGNISFGSTTYSLSVQLYSGSACAYGGGGTYEVFAYSQFGNYTIGSLNAAGATEILYTSTSSILTGYDGTSGSGTQTQGQGWMTQLNLGCTTGGSFSFPATDQRNVGAVAQPQAAAQEGCQSHAHLSRACAVHRG